MTTPIQGPRSLGLLALALLAECLEPLVEHALALLGYTWSNLI